MTLNEREEVAAKALRMIVDEIQRFGEKCAEFDYTDTGDAWELFNHIETLAEMALEAFHDE